TFPFYHAPSIANRLEPSFSAVLIKTSQAQSSTHTFQMRPFAVRLPELLVQYFRIDVYDASIAKEADNVWIIFSNHVYDVLFASDRLDCSVT
ncbi:MAG: hypothetical protein ACXV4B_03965, partial [Halobacteriota archaeon]